MVIFTTFLPCSETPFHFDLKHFSFPFADWPGKSTVQLNLSYPKYRASVQRSNLFFCHQSICYTPSLHCYDLLCSVALDVIIWAEQNCKRGRFLWPDLKLLFAANTEKETKCCLNFFFSRSTSKKKRKRRWERKYVIEKHKAQRQYLLISRFYFLFIF